MSDCSTRANIKPDKKWLKEKYLEQFIFNIKTIKQIHDNGDYSDEDFAYVVNMLCSEIQEFFQKHELNVEGFITPTVPQDIEIEEVANPYKTFTEEVDNTIQKYDEKIIDELYVCSYLASAYQELEIRTSKKGYTKVKK